jgi:hypothetical protein
MAMRMRQSISDMEQAFAEEMLLDRRRREHLRQTAVQRSRQRRMERAHKEGSFRFALLVVALLATAVTVTVVMFETLYYVMG